MAYDTLEELLDHLRNVTNLTVSCCNSKYRSTDSGKPLLPDDSFLRESTVHLYQFRH